MCARGLLINYLNELRKISNARLAFYRIFAVS